MKNVAFIINPFSAKGKYQPILEEIRKNIAEPLVYISESVEGTERFIQEVFDKVQIFIAIGGDGTISNVASHLINTDKILGIYPAGSGNGFSNETNFRKDIDNLLEKIKRGNAKKIDTFSVNGRLSINVSGTGFDGKVVKEFEKTNRGFKNYIKVSVQTFFKYKPIKINFLDEKYKRFNGRYLMMNVANTRQFGNNAYIAPNASMSDGLVDLVLVKKFPLHYSAGFAYRMFSKKLKSDQYITYLSASEIEFEVDTKDWHIDGEYNEIPSPISIKVSPKSLNILV